MSAPIADLAPLLHKHRCILFVIPRKNGTTTVQISPINGKGKGFKFKRNAVSATDSLMHALAEMGEHPPME